MKHGHIIFLDKFFPIGHQTLRVEFLGFFHSKGCSHSCDLKANRILDWSTGTVKNRDRHTPPECEELSNTGFLPLIFSADVAKCPAFAANSFLALPESVCLQASPPTPLASDIPSCPPKIGEGAFSPLSTLLGGFSEIRCRQTPSSA